MIRALKAVEDLFRQIYEGVFQRRTTALGRVQFFFNELRVPSERFGPKPLGVTKT